MVFSHSPGDISVFNFLPHFDKITVDQTNWLRSSNKLQGE